MGIANSEVLLAVYDVEVVFVGLIYDMVLPQRVHEECLHQFLVIDGDGVDGIHKIAIVHHHLGRLLGEFFSYRIDDIDKTRIGQILDIVHHRGTAGLYFISQIADIGRLGTFDSQEIKQLLDFVKILQLYLLDKEDVDLGHHIHGLQEILGEIAMFQEEWVKTMMDIVVKVLERAHLGQNGLDDMLMVVQNLAQRIGTKAVAGLLVVEVSE